MNIIKRIIGVFRKPDPDASIRYVEQRPKEATSPSTGRLRAKPWGLMSIVRLDDSVEVCGITVEPGGFCSKHFHSDKWNLFHVLDGEMEVVIYSPSGEPRSYTTLHAGEETVVAPGTVHRFRVYERCIAVEVYWPASGKYLVHEDIQRLDDGGRR